MQFYMYILCTMFKCGFVVIWQVHIHTHAPHTRTQPHIWQENMLSVVIVLERCIQIRFIFPLFCSNAGTGMAACNMLMQVDWPYILAYVYVHICVFGSNSIIYAWMGECSVQNAYSTLSKVPSIVRVLYTTCSMAHIINWPFRYAECS